MSRSNMKSVCLGALIGVLGIAVTAVAATPEDTIKYRQAVMKSVGGHTGAIAQIVRGKVDHKEDLAYHAESISRSLDNVPKLFPDGSDFGETRALASIWEKSDDFKQKASDAKDAAAAFAAAAESGNESEIGPKFKTLVDACKACHKDYREEE